jgi:hypothetical protein
VLGVALAVVDIAATLSLLTSRVTPLIPIGRFGSMFWLVAISVLLPRTRAARGTSRALGSLEQERSGGL